MTIELSMDGKTLRIEGQNREETIAMLKELTTLLECWHRMAKEKAAEKGPVPE